MRAPHSTLNAVTAGSVIGFGLLALVSSSAVAADASPSTETYTWSAELVEVDEPSRTATVKARVVGEPENIETASLSEGDRAMLTWSGITYGAGIRALEAGEESSFDRMSMPIEFVSAGDDGHIVFRVQVPAESAAAISGLDAGQWVTVTSPHAPDAFEEAVLSMRPYGDVD